MLSARPALWRRLTSYGQTATALALTEGEKLAARALLRGETIDEAFATAGLDEAEARAARQVFRALRLLVRGRAASEGSRFEEGVGLNFHTVRVEGESAFAVH